MRHYPLFLLLILTSLSGCAGERGKIPSLLPRDIEQRDDLEPVRVAPVPQADASLDAQIGDFDKQLDANAQQFDGLLAGARTAASAATGADPGSQRWLDAQNDLSPLDGAHAQTILLAATLDRLAIDRAAKGLPDDAGLNALRARVDKRIEMEQRDVAALHDQLK
jgi:hypothetical protein